MIRSVKTYASAFAVLVSLLLLSVIFVQKGEARYISTFRDLLSDSAPGEYSNHTISFVTGADIPPSGFIRITPENSFDIPGATFGQNQVELYVDNVLRPASSTPDADYDSATITSGAGGNVEITLNSSTGINSGSSVRVLLGTHTANSTTTDTGILNPATTGTAPVLIEFGGGAEEGRARALVAIVEQVGVGPVDTRESQPPFRSNGNPDGTLAGTVTSAEITLETDEFATCRYATASGTPFFTMNNQFTVTGSIFHSFVATGLVAETTYTYYVRCIDDEGNFNSDDFIITFTIAPTPAGEAGEGEDEGGGSDSGSGDGSSGDGSGSSGGDTSGSGSGGGTRGGGGGGGGLNDDDLYESGDATVVISGYAFPASRVVTLIDGEEFDDSTQSNGDGRFSVTVPDIARGVYTFGVYVIDRDGTKSSTFSTTFSVIGSRVSTLSNIHLMPSIKVTPDPVEPGAQVTFSGYAIQNSTVTLETQQEKSSASKKTYTATSDGNGRWSTTVSTAGFARDTWKVRAKSEQATGGIASQFSQYTFYGVGTTGQPTQSGNNSDLNRDGKVNLIDFSILLFHWNTDGGASNPPADINRDGKVSLTDFSIMIFNWTG